MAVAVKLPKMSDTMEEGVLVSWQVKVGDDVKPGDVLAEVETDKATMDLENYEKGTVLHLNVEEGATMPIDSVIAIIGKSGESFDDLLKQTSSAPAKVEEAAAPVATPEPSAPAVSTAQPVTSPVDSDSRVKASPLAKMLAKEMGVDIGLINGSGEGGRIVKRDVETYTPQMAPAAASSVSASESYTDIPVSQMRKTIARRLGESKFTAPHFYLTMEVRMDKAIEARKQINEYVETRVSMNDLIVKAAAIALRKHPKVNSAWMGDKIRRYDHIHIGVAMAVEDGLLVPVVRHADFKSLSQISSEVKSYSVRAKEKKLQPADWEGNTFTISNLGMYGIEEFTAIINPPDSCILAIGAAKETVVVENGELAVGNVMKVTLSCDHRSVDGVVGSEFLLTFKELMENPVKLLA
ncbi:MAG: pyruvate dehydrogenase complex dihydrolipoamide acetyltransferase [Flavobacteriales bacterium]|nr:pyruvate dehydrogenase complex dihydrolipoamide acetyltransferase [Bacteroidota bacterium]MCB9241350.1 pyruvate dehydrogenase complex dihydrolipoamide acetyltransferase [Flavobacteriales bacterium]